jgi:hypothetical protein
LADPVGFLSELALKDMLTYLQAAGEHFLKDDQKAILAIFAKMTL